MKTIIVLLLIFLFNNSAVTQVVSADSAFLCAFFDAMEGQNWKNKAGWKSNVPIRNWHGFKIN